jgi:hypothetical protein
MKASNGETWDPALHEDPPRGNARGGWARKRGGARGGRAPSSTAPRAHQPQPLETTPELSTDEINAKIAANATLAANLLFLAGKMIVGECMEPDDTERAGITGAFSDYFRSTQTIEIPPWFGLVAAIGLYGARRWNHPEFIATRKTLTGGEKPKDA